MILATGLRPAPGSPRRSLGQQLPLPVSLAGDLLLLLVCIALERLCLLSTRPRVRAALGAPSFPCRSDPVSWLLRMIFKRLAWV